MSLGNRHRWACVAGGAAFLTAALVGTSCAASGPLSIRAEADSWVDAGHPTLNHGTTSYLQLDASPALRGYLRFTVAVPAGEHVSRAVLSITPNQSNSAGVVVRTSASNWSESGINYGNAPAPVSAVSARSGPLTAGASAQIDVTGAVPASGGPVTFVLENASGTSFSIASRERSSAQPSLQVSTTGTSTSSIPAPPSPPAAPKLAWAPPVMNSPVTYHVSGDGPGSIKAAPGQDSIVVWDAPTHRRIRFDGGRNWIIRGGEVVNDKQWPNLDDQGGLQFENVTGTAFVEGLYIHGSYGKDGIRVGAGGSNTTLIVQNSRIIERMSGATVYHTDVIQPFGGIKELKVDRMTGSGDYQGQMWKEEPGTSFGPSDFRHVNYRAATPEVQYMINFVDANPTDAVTLSEVYNQPDPLFVGGNFCRAQTGATYCGTDANGKRYVMWAGKPTTVNGRVTQGLPPGGDFVPAGAAGMSYISPGYLN